MYKQMILVFKIATHIYHGQEDKSIFPEVKNHSIGFVDVATLLFQRLVRDLILLAELK